MLPEDSPAPGIPQPDSPEPEVEPISPEEAEAILQAEMEPYLAEGWQVLHESAYTARLTRGMHNLDIHVDLLGNVKKQETPLTPVQDSGRLMAWMLLIAMLMVALALSSALGIL